MTDTEAQRVRDMEARLDELERRLHTRGRARVGLFAAVIATGLLVWGTTALSAPASPLSCSGGDLYCFAPGEPALASQVNSNFATVFDRATTLTFQNMARPKLVLWSSPEYSIGIQSSTQYYRTGTNFAWYQGGTHEDGALDPGGGATMMTLTPSGLSVSGAATVGGSLTVGGATAFNADVSGLSVTTTECENVADTCETDGGGLVYLDRMNNLSCPANKVLVDWGVNNCGGGSYQMVFRCCALAVQ